VLDGAPGERQEARERRAAQALQRERERNTSQLEAGVTCDELGETNIPVIPGTEIDADSDAEGSATTEPNTPLHEGLCAASAGETVDHGTTPSAFERSTQGKCRLHVVGAGRPSSRRVIPPRGHECALSRG
jgi:hypothetical protein